MTIFIPIYNAQALGNVWPKTIEGFSSILKHSVGDTSLEAIYSDLLAGIMTLWEIQTNGEYAGFLTTTISEKVKAKRALMIYFMYLKPGTPKEVLAQANDEMMSVATERGCKQIQFYTTREAAFAERLKGWGYQKSYVQFVKEVG